MKKTKKVLERCPDNINHLEHICGIDEVGRGCGAGPVFTSAVILPRDFTSDLIRDSKKLSEKQRNEAYKLIMDNALYVSCEYGSVDEINEHGIDKATFKSMYKCISNLSVEPEHILVDGISWETYGDEKDYNEIVTLVPKGDDTYLSIAAAAIIAKVTRDKYMTDLSESYPNYFWGKNKGYLTSDHISAIKEFGPNEHHRTKYIRNFVNN
jgi:ribonuclease HII